MVFRSPPAGAPARRRRTRARLGRAALALLAVVVLVVVIGVATDYHSASTGYDAEVDASFVALAAGAAHLSAVSTSGMDAVLSGGAGLGRIELFGRLGAIETAAQEAAASLSEARLPAATPVGYDQCQAALAARATFATAFARAVTGLLGGESGFGSGDESAATAALEAVGRGLRASDARWATCGRRLARAPGRQHLARFAAAGTGSVWSARALGQEVARMVASASLAVRRRLELAWAIAPPAVASNGPVGVVTPTNAVTVTVTVIDDGNVGEPGVTATVSLTPARVAAADRLDPTGPPVVRTGRIAVTLEPGAARALPAFRFTVRPGHSYLLEVRTAGAGEVRPAPLEAPLTIGAASPGPG